MLLTAGWSFMPRCGGERMELEIIQDKEDAVQVYELGAAAFARMVPVDLATLEDEPPSPIGHFEFHGCACGVASFVGQPPWELHNRGDELLHILAGQCELTVLSEDTEEIRLLKAGDI